MQLLSIYLVSERFVAAVLKFHRYSLGCYAQLRRRSVFCAFLQLVVFLPVDENKLSALHLRDLAVSATQNITVCC